MTLLKDNNYKDINVALLSLEADIKNKITNFDTSVIDKQLAEINSRIDKINAGGGNSSASINDIRYEIEDINSKLNGNSAKIKNIEQKLSDIFSAENKVTDFNTTTDSGIYYWVDDAANRPTDYGVLLVNKYDSGSGSWINQIAYGTDNKIYFRQNINSGNWTEWKAVAFDGEITAYKVANALTVNGKTYDGSEAVDAGVQKIENGGTGVTTQADINKAFIGNLGEGTSDVTDGTMFVSSYATDNGFADTDAFNVPFKRKFSTVWNYIKGKISSVLGLTASSYGGKAAAATRVEDGNNVIQYKATSLNGYKIQDTQEKALYVEGRELDSGDSGGIAITNDCVTAFGAGDTDGVFRVINEDNVSAGPVFKVMKDGQVYTTNTIHGSIDGKASTAGTAAAILDYNRNTPIKVRWGGAGINSAEWYPAFNADGSALEPINRTNIHAGTADSARNMYYQNLDLTSLDKTKFYPLVCFSGNDFAEVAICSESGMASMEYNQNRIHFDISTMGWSDLPYTLNIREYACYENSEITIGCIGRGLHSGAWAIWLRGGLHYTCFSRNSDLSLHTSDYTYGDETYTVGTNYYGGSNTNVSIWFTPQSTITEGAYSNRSITAPRIKADNRMVIPIGAPSSLEDGCIWIS